MGLGQKTQRPIRANIHSTDPKEVEWLKKKIEAAMLRDQKQRKLEADK